MQKERKKNHPEFLYYGAWNQFRKGLVSLNFHTAKKKSLSVYQICQKVDSSLACEAGPGHIYFQKERKTSKILKFWWLDSYDILIYFFAVYFKGGLCCFFSFLTCDRNEKKIAEWLATGLERTEET